jgi:hypothetical protein
MTLLGNDDWLTRCFCSLLGLSNGPQCCGVGDSFVPPHKFPSRSLLILVLRHFQIAKHFLVGGTSAVFVIMPLSKRVVAHPYAKGWATVYLLVRPA